MKKLQLLLVCTVVAFSFSANAQDRDKSNPVYIGTVTSMEYVTPLASRMNDLIPSDDSIKEAKDKRSRGGIVVPGKDPQTLDDYFVRNRHEMERSVSRAPASLVFDGYSSGSQPTDPALAVGPNHVFVVFNTGFTIYDKSGNQLVGQTSPSPAIFPNGGCCDLTASYDSAADRWVLTFLGNGAQIAVSDGSNPVTSGWYVYTISAINDYQKLSVWSDGYYMTDNTTSSNKVWALERDQMLLGNPSAQILGFDLPGIQTFGFYSPQALNVTDDNMPAAGGATIVYMQDDAWSGVSNDHIKLWTIDVDWNTPGNSTVSSPQQISTTPFIGVFDNGSFSNLRQPRGGGRATSIDALQATIMNQAQFRKFGTHNSAVFNFVVDTDASNNGELAGVRWYEFRQSGDNQPWSLYQEGTYTAPDNRHAWNASLAMDANGNIGMGYTSMSSSSSSNTVRVSSYFTGRMSSDPLGVMTSAEELIANGNSNIPGTRYGDYSKIDVDPVDDETFWFINEYNNNGRKGVVGVFKIQAGPPDTQPPTDPTNLTASNITSSGATLTWNASTDNVGVDHYNVSIDGNQVGTSTTTSFNVTGLSPLTQYNASVTAEDAAGNVSGSANTTFTTQDNGGNNGEIAAYYFETGFDGWTDGGSDCARVSSSNSFEGSWSIRLRDGSSTSIATSPVLDFSGNSQIEIDFYVMASGMNNGLTFEVEFSDGTGFQTVATYTAGTDFNNGTFFNANIVLPSGSYNFNTNNQIRIRNNANNNGDQIYFDQVVISGDPPPAVLGDEITLRSPEAQQAKNLTLGNRILLHPNPTNTMLTIDMLDGGFDKVMIFSSTGTLVRTLDINADSVSLDVSELASGMYFARFISGKLAVTKRFVKK